MGVVIVVYSHFHVLSPAQPVIITLCVSGCSRNRKDLESLPMLQASWRLSTGAVYGALVMLIKGDTPECIIDKVPGSVYLKQNSGETQAVSVPGASCVRHQDVVSFVTAPGWLVDRDAVF